jgi:uncharacterized membrane protein
MRPLLIILLVPFSVYTAWVAWEFGYTSVFTVGLREHPTTQALIDLFISVGMLMLLMIADSKRNKRSKRKIAPFIILTLLLGAIGPLIYFLTYPGLLSSDEK